MVGSRKRVVTRVAIVGLLLLASEAASQPPTVPEAPLVIEGRVLWVDFGSQTMALAPANNTPTVMIDLHRILLADTKADGSADIVEDRLGAWSQIAITRVEPDRHVATGNVEADTTDGDIVLVGDHPADGVGVAEVAVSAQDAFHRAADRHAALHLRERLGLVFTVDLDVAHDVLLFVFECNGQRGWI